MTIVNDILDLSKIQADKLELAIMEFDLDLAIKDIVSLPEVQARQKGIDFSYTIDPEVPCLIQGDIGRIRQIINNLTGNAIKFTDSGEVTLKISVKSEDDTDVILHFSIEDTGIGIKEDQIDTLFDSFTQAEFSTTKNFGGTGLGLTISKLLVEKMDGEIGAESIDMIGSTFWFTLPLKKQVKKKNRVEPVTSSIDNGKVLVLSDGKSVGIQFERNLPELKIHYSQTFDDTQAMEVLNREYDAGQPFDVVILEAKEFDMTAETLGRKIKQDDRLKQTKLVLLTNIGKKGDARRFEDIGFSAFLSGRVNAALLLDSLNAVLARPEFEKKENLPIITRYTINENKKYRQRILIVDDIETNRLTAKALIKKQGYKTDEAENGADAVQKYREIPYDLILMDCGMPVMDGLEATRQIRKLEKLNQKNPVPIFAMTGNAFASDRQTCFKAGMNDFLAKPIDPEIFVQKIRSILTAVGGYTKAELFEQKKNDQKKTDATAGTYFSAELNQEKEPVMCFNQKKLFERFGGDKEIVEVVIDSFFQEAPGLLQKLGTAVGKNEIKDVRSISHALIGIAANVNADGLATKALALETDAKNQNSTSFFFSI